MSKKPARTATLSRKTKETRIELSLNLDGTGQSTIATGVGFFDHMLDLLARHSLIDLEIKADGDLHVDAHHTVEDVGIVLGQAIEKSLGDKRGIYRYGWAIVPMDETLAQVALDLSGRAAFVFNAPLDGKSIGEFPAELVEEFFKSVAQNAKMNLHLAVPYGTNTHHISEAIFKATAKALRQAVSLDPRNSDVPQHQGFALALSGVPALLRLPSMKTRRDFLSQIGIGTFGLLSATALGKAFGGTLAAQSESFKGTAVFDRILAKALKNKWETLPIGQCMGHVAMEFRGTPYVGFTLELNKDREICAVDLLGLDCVTFFEDTLDFSRMLKLGGRTPEAMLEQIQFTRYRGGHMTNFLSRLHYTTDWFVDNQKKGVVKILAPELPGAEPYTQKVGIMSAHPENYKQLVAHPEYIATIKKYENTINSRSLMYIPLDKLAGVESYLRTGDIVGVCENVPGIDIGHTGLVIQDANGVPHFMDASSSRRNMKVTLETPPISNTFTWSRHITGAMFARPLEPVA